MFNAVSILRDRIRFASIKAEEGHEVMTSFSQMTVLPLWMV